MPLPSESELLKHLAKTPRDEHSLRDLAHHFSVPKEQQNDFMYWLDGLSVAKRIQRTKAKTYQSSPEERSQSSRFDRLKQKFGSGDRKSSRAVARDRGRDARRGGGFASEGRGGARDRDGGRGGAQFGSGARGAAPRGGGAARDQRQGKFAKVGGFQRGPRNEGRSVPDSYRDRGGRDAKGRGDRDGAPAGKGKSQFPPRPATQTVATLTQLSPPMARISNDEMEAIVAVQGDLRGLKVGDAAVFHKRETREGEHLEVELPLGDPEAPRVTVYEIAMRHAFIAKFSPEAERMSSTMQRPGPEHLQDGRVDVRHLPLVTIDGDDAKDFDDAVYAEKRADGNGFRLVVAIADVSHYVRPGSALDQEGQARGTSVYFPGFVLPMLPYALSDDLCSLRPDEDRLCFIADMHIDSEGKIASSKSYRGLMRSRARLTYGEVEAAVNQGVQNKAAGLGQPLADFTECSRLLRRAKEKRGALDLDMPEGLILLGKDGMPTDSVRRSRFESHRLIEDAMLAANSAIAAEMRGKDIPAAYRVHAEPSEQKLELLTRMAQQIGVRARLPLPPSPKQLATYVDELSHAPGGKLLVPNVLRALARAEYKAEPLGHYALASPDYLHFTSPIRRFPDLVTHRSLGSLGRDAPKRLDLMCASLSERERAAETASRSVNDFYRCLLAKPMIGDEFDATVISVLEFGVFVETDKPYLEGLLPVRSLGGEYFEIDEGMTRLHSRSGRSVALGDKLRVRLRDVRLSKRQLEFELVQPPARKPKQKDKA